MIDAVFTILKLIAAALPFVALCLASSRVNLKKEERSLQFPMPAIALVYCIVAVIFLHKISEWLLSFVEAVPRWIAGLGGLPFVPAALSGALGSLSETVRRWLEGLNMDLWIFFIANTAILAVFLILKRIAISVCKRAVRPSSALYQKVAGYFYEADEESGAMCVMDGWSHARGLMRVFYYVGVALSVVLFIVSRYLYMNDLIRAVFYPVFGVLLVGEAYFFLDGLTKTEYRRNILGEDDFAQHNVNYSLLRGFLGGLFGDRLKAEDTQFNADLTGGTTNDDVLEPLRNSADRRESTFAMYYDAMVRGGLELDHNYFYSSLDLLHGKSILFNNPFYYDLVPYAFYPMHSALLNHGKVLVVLGRHAMEEDAEKWLREGVAAVTNVPFLWKIEVLGDTPVETDIGILTRADVLDVKIHSANEEFLEQVSFVVILEPSKLISTAQIGLNMLVKKCLRGRERNIVYCLCDKNCDGLVDAMSHILLTSITEVSATGRHKGVNSYMVWDVDDDYLQHRMLPSISRYLGVGTELSFAALKNQVSRAVWYGGEAFPVTDMRWIDRQYYFDLMKYAGLPANQDEMDRRFVTSPNFWDARREKYQYMTVEDEFFNMFEAVRDFSTRATQQGFVNVVSSDYLLADYMADNSDIFAADPKAIPCIVPDFVRSRRNTALKLVLMLSVEPTPETLIVKELSLGNIAVTDLPAQLWHEIYLCFAPTPALSEIPENYADAVAFTAEKTLSLPGDARAEIGPSVIVSAERFNVRTGRIEKIYEIRDKRFISGFVRQLRSASYVTEDEKGSCHYFGAELIGHIYQRFLPGQFFTFDGKYYRMDGVTAEGDILVRRSSDHISRRRFYRQLRTYTLSNRSRDTFAGAARDVSGVKVVHEHADIFVHTAGYLDMTRYSDFRTAKTVRLDLPGVEPIERSFTHKSLLTLSFPDENGKRTNEVRYTLAVLMNEVFRTLFAENAAYVVALTDDSFLPADAPRLLTYGVEAEETDPGCIYIVEDSQLDLGLLDAVERNLERILEIVADQLTWHFEKLEEILDPPPAPAPVVPPVPEDEPAPKKGFFARLIDRLFRRKKGDRQKEKEEKRARKKQEKEERRKKKKGEPVPEEPTPEEPVPEEPVPEEPVPEEPVPEEPVPEEPVPEEPVPEEPVPEEPVPEEPVPEEPVPEEPVPEEPVPEEPVPEEPVPEEPVPEEKPAPDAALMPAPVEDGDVEKVTEEDLFTDWAKKTERRPYQTRYFTLFGYSAVPAAIDLDGTLDYLGSVTRGANPLTEARDNRLLSAYLTAKTLSSDDKTARRCDFCGMPILGVEFDTLADGRDRCLNCSRTALKTGEEFRTLFTKVKADLETYFHIRISNKVNVEMVNARTLHARLGEVFTPSADFDGRTLGVAIRRRNQFSLLVENGSPRMATMLTVAHELTHIWQYLNWDPKMAAALYGKEKELEIYEGMAKWVEVQYAWLIGEGAAAKRKELETMLRPDAYGRGFIRYRANYPIRPGVEPVPDSPFMHPDRPLAEEYAVPLGELYILPPDLPQPVEEKRARRRARRNWLGSDKDLLKKGVKGQKLRDPEKVAPYACSLLTDPEREVYTRILEAINAHTASVDGLAAFGVHKDRFDLLTRFVAFDHPELFWYVNRVYTFNTETGIVNEVKLCYGLTPEETEERRREIEENLSAFTAGITDGMSDYEVVLRVYENVIANTDYDKLGLEAQDKERAENNGAIAGPDDLRNIYGVFVLRKAVCAGYAKAVQYLLNRYGIDCIYASNGEHAWNLVFLEGEWYHLDATWGDSSNTKPEENSSDEISYDCFCITDEDLSRIKSHQPPEGYPLPPCTATACNYYRRFGAYFETASFEGVRDYCVSAAANGQTLIAFRAASDEVYEDLSRMLFTEGRFGDVISLINLKTRVRVAQSYSYVRRPQYRTIKIYLQKL